MNNETKKGKLVPELRFPGFEGEWEVKKLGNVCNVVDDKCGIGSLTIVTYISTENMLQDFEGVKIASKLPNSGSFTQFNKGDILFSNIRPYLKKVWQAVFDGAASNDVIVFRTLDGYDRLFVSQVIKSDRFIAHSMSGAKGVKMPRGDKKMMLDYLFSIPSLPEQQKIAECLSSVDDLIQAEADQLQALKDHKKGLMQKLFPQEGETTPKLRFPGFEGEWEEKKFNDIFSLLSNNTCSRAEMDNNIGVALNVHYGDILTKYNEILDVQKTNIPYVTDNDLLVKYKDSFLQDGDIIISDTAEDSTVGKCTEIQNHQEIIILSGLHTIPVRPQRKFAKGYLGYFLNSESYHNQLLPLMQGAKVSSISRTAIKKTKIFFPSLPEQQKIAECLSSLDEGIAAQQEKVEALKEHKKGLMQKLFPNLQ